MQTVTDFQIRVLVFTRPGAALTTEIGSPDANWSQRNVASDFRLRSFYWLQQIEGTSRSAEAMFLLVWCSQPGDPIFTSSSDVLSPCEEKGNKIQLSKRRGQSEGQICCCTNKERYTDVKKTSIPGEKGWSWASEINGVELKSVWMAFEKIHCYIIYYNYIYDIWPPLWSSGQSSWLQILRSRVRFPGTKKSSGSGTGSTQPREYNWRATWKKT
jgi:hypothetical protein